MKTQKFMRLAGLVMMFILVAVFSQAKDPAAKTDKKDETLALTLTGYVVETYFDEEGKEQEKLVPLEKAVFPGDIIHYEIIGKNTAGKPLRDVHVGGKIPYGTAYVDKSAAHDQKGEFLVSTNGGGTFAKPPIIIKVTQPNGTVKEVIVPPEKYTNIQFTIPEIKKKGKFSGSYRVAVK